MARLRFLSVLSSVFVFLSCSDDGDEPPSDGNDGGTAGSAETAGSGGMSAPAAGAVNAGQAGSNTGGAIGGGTAGQAGNAGSVNSSANAGTVNSSAGNAGSVNSSAGTAGVSGNGGRGGAEAGAPMLGEPREKALEGLSSVRQEHAVAALRGEVYVVGGYTPQATASVLAYDPESAKWRGIPDFPAILNHANVGVAIDKLFVAGYYVGSGMNTASPQVYAYDPDDDEWTEKKSMPARTERAAACTAVLGDKIYVFGGARGGTTVKDASVYDAVSDTWQELPAMPTAREHCAAGAVGNKIYIVAGRANGIEGFEPSSLEFDPASPGYVEKKPITTPRGGVAGAVVGNRVFVLGGEGNDSVTSGVFPNVEGYDPSTNTWTSYPPLAVPRHGMGAAVVDGRIYIPGGATGQGFGAADDVSVYYFE